MKDDFESKRSKKKTSIAREGQFLNFPTEFPDLMKFELA